MDERKADATAAVIVRNSSIYYLPSRSSHLLTATCDWCRTDVIVYGNSTPGARRYGWTMEAGRWKDLANESENRNKQKAQLLQRDRATLFVSWNIVNCCTTLREIKLARYK